MATIKYGAKTNQVCLATTCIETIKEELFVSKNQDILALRISDESF